MHTKTSKVWSEENLGEEIMTSRTALVTGADHGLGLALTEQLLERGWTVIAGRYLPREDHLTSLAEKSGEDKLTIVSMDVSDLGSVDAAAARIRTKHPVIDLVVNNAAVLGNAGLDNKVADGLDYESIVNTVSVNALGALRVVESFLPAVSESQLRRLCFVSSEAASISRSHRRSWFGYSMSKSALNMGVSILFNDLRPDGFTFRLYHPGWMQTLMKGTVDREALLSPMDAADRALKYFLDAEIDEDRLVMRDYEGKDWPW